MPDDLKYPFTGRLFILILILTAVSSLFVIKEVIIPNIDLRIELEQQILSGQAAPPYQYRILKPMIARALEFILSPVLHSEKTRHLISHSAITLSVFFGIYLLFYIYLRKYYSEKSSIIGILLLQAVVPLAVTGYYMIGDFITLLFYGLGFLLFINNKDAFIPALIAVAVLNREQSIFLIVFYAIFRYSEGRILKRKCLVTIVASILMFAVVFLGVRFYFGFKPTAYSMVTHISHNLAPANLFGRIAPLWIAEFAGFLILCLMAYRRSGRFLKLSFLSLGIYLLLFFINGNLWEMAKFLPAYLILIPMSLQAFTGEYPLISGEKPVAPAG